MRTTASSSSNRSMALSAFRSLISLLLAFRLVAMKMVSMAPWLQRDSNPSSTTSMADIISVKALRYSACGNGLPDALAA
jgi:hypothetical protein